MKSNRQNFKPPGSDDEIRELAHLHATEGVLDEGALLDWLDHASEQEQEIFTEEVNAVGMLSLALTPPSKAPALKLADIVAPAEKSFPPGFTYLANGSGEWRELPVKGARVKELSDDRSDGFTTMLLEMDAGARFPGHHHHGAEQVYLLDGDLYSDGEELSPGDFLRAAADTHHGGLYSKNGCHALIITAGGKRPLSVGESGEKCRIHVDGSDGISIGPAKGTGRSGVACAKAPAKDAVGGRITGRWDDSQDNQQEMLHHPAIRVGQESRGNRKEVPGNPEEHAECFSSLF